jgi:hypothetical protein
LQLGRRVMINVSDTCIRTCKHGYEYVSKTYLHVTHSRVTRAVLLNMSDQYINNFDTAKNARLTREHTHLTRVHV